MVNWVVKLRFVVGGEFGLKMEALEVEDLEGEEGELVSPPFRDITVEQVEKIATRK